MASFYSEGEVPVNIVCKSRGPRFCCSGVKHKHIWIKPVGYETGIQVYNCVAKDKVPLIVKNKDAITWYTCGPTVYDSSHLGHASCYVKLDIIQRILKNYFKLNVVAIMNVTDIDDKIIKKSNETNVSPVALANKYEKEFWSDLESLNVSKPNLIVKVTENISIIQNFIKKLLITDQAYVCTDGSVYFDLSKCENYEKLQNVGKVSTLENAMKKSSFDFALWKGSSNVEEPAWDSDWGRGRPGWHAECSALASHVLGSTVDIHAGGMDLRFPHHENEEAQSCAYFSKSQWVNYWIHTGHLHLRDSVKMSKSLQNTLSIPDMLSHYSADVFRMACLMSHYRNNMEYSNEYMNSAKSLLNKYKYFVSDCKSFIKSNLSADVDKNVLLNDLAEAVNKIHQALIDDFDTASVINIINSLVSSTNKILQSLHSHETDGLNHITYVMAVLNFVNQIFSMVGINLEPKSTDLLEDNALSDVIDILLNFRHNIRQIGITNKDQALLSFCDSVRSDLKKCEITVRDGGKVSSWSR